MTAEKKHRPLFGIMRPVSFAAHFSDSEGYCGTFTANAFWSQDGVTCSAGFGLKETALTLDEMRAIRDCLSAAIEAREEYDAAYAADDEPPA